MNSKQIDLSTYTTNHEFYPEIKLLITIKSFDLQAIRKRYLENKHKKSNRAGSVTRRESSTGGIAELTIKKGEITNLQMLTKLKEPRGIDSTKNITAFSSENKVHILNGQSLETITNPWFSYIHTVDINRRTMDHFLVSSSGFDCIFEYSVQNKQKTFEWFAWENGFNHGLDPETGDKLFITRNQQIADQYYSDGEKYIYISDPIKQNLPTAMRAAFINSVVYDPTNRNNIIATFFHEGAVYQINRINGKAIKVLDGLKNPHGGMKLKENYFIGTSTTGGEIVTATADHQNRYTFKNLKDKPGFLTDMEWIQNSKPINNNFIAIDSNRNSFVIINPEKQLISPIKFDPNWAIQDLVVSYLDANQKDIIRSITSQ